MAGERAPEDTDAVVAAATAGASGADDYADDMDLSYTAEDEAAFLEQLHIVFDMPSVSPYFVVQFTRVPYFKLYRAVTLNGGYEQVKARRLWGVIGLRLGIPETCRYMSSALRQTYENHLLGYEKLFFVPHNKPVLRTRNKRKAPPGILGTLRSLHDSPSKKGAVGESHFGSARVALLGPPPAPAPALPPAPPPPHLMHSASAARTVPHDVNLISETIIGPHDMMQVGDVHGNAHSVDVAAALALVHTNVGLEGYSDAAEPSVLTTVDPSAVVKLTIDDVPALPAFEAMMDSIARQPSVHVLDLSHCHLGDDFVMCVALILPYNESIQHLNLEDNQLTSAGIAKVARALRTNHVIQEVDLSGNTIGAALPRLMELLSESTSLRTLVLKQTDLDNNDIAELAEAIQTNHNVRYRGQISLLVD